MSLLPLLLSFAPGLALDEPPELALEGLDAIELAEGRRTPGSPELEVRADGYTYRFCSEEHLRRFEQDPARLGIQWGGSCGGMGLLSGRGDPARFEVWQGRIWIFASDACRDGFREDPDGLMPQPDPAPEGSPEAAARGRQMLEGMLEALGGAARIDALRSYRESRFEEVESQGTTWKHHDSQCFLFPEGTGRPGGYSRRSAWNELVSADVLSADGGFRDDGSTSRPMVPAQRDEMQRLASHHPLWILRQRQRADFVVLDEGMRDGLRSIVVHFGGNTTRLGLDPQGRPVRARFVDRSAETVGRRAATELRYSDWREVEGLHLPFGRETLWKGKRVASRSRSLQSIELDREEHRREFQPRPRDDDR